MATKQKPIFDGATLSPKLKAEVDPDSVSLPIGKVAGAGGATVARAYKHAAGKSDTYSPEVVDMIYHMARGGTFTDEHASEFVAAKLAAERDVTRATPPLTWDQLVFLSANLTRLVIDPYRERCNSQVQLGADRTKPLTLEWPIIFGGIDLGRLPEPLPSYFLRTAAKAGLAVEMDSCSIDADCKVQRILRVDATKPLPPIQAAAAVELDAPLATKLDRRHLAPAIEAVRKATDAQVPVGIVAPAFNAPTVVNETIELEVDFYVTDAQWTQDEKPTNVFPEGLAAPAIHVLADTVDRLRHHCREETVQVIYRGGIRGGADAGKAICLGATAVSLGLAAVVGMGFRLTQIRDEDAILKQMESESRDPEQIATHLYNFAKSVNMEVTILARACGKSSVTNMEPEDMRALTSAVSAATGIPLVGKDMNFRRTLD